MTTKTKTTEAIKSKIITVEEKELTVEERRDEFMKFLENVYGVKRPSAAREDDPRELRRGQQSLKEGLAQLLFDARSWGHYGDLWLGLSGQRFMIGQVTYDDADRLSDGLWDREYNGEDCYDDE